MKPLKTVILYSAGHMGSATILNQLLDSDIFEFKGIVKARALPFSRKGARQLKRNLKKTGWQFGWLMVWQQLVQSFAFLINNLLPQRRKRLLPAWMIARKKGIPVHYSDNVNDETCRNFIESFKPDLVISAYFNQILKKEAIAIPKIGILNIHPGWLPAYRGAMCYFWVLKNGEQKGGVSVHWIDEGIDTGELLAREQFEIKEGWTQQKVLESTAVIGAKLIKEVARKLQHGETPKALSEIDSEQADYFPMPKRADFKDYFSNKRFFRIRDIFRLFMKKRK
ncbi:MAG: hypothetical protein MI892_32040 [Desulfobacterales bacterium]|nr:hypothetical protein [Desulfobacterales bacterium]